MTLKANALEAYPVHVVLINSTNEFRPYLVVHKYTLAAMLPVSSSDICSQEIYGNDKSYINLAPALNVVALCNGVPATIKMNGRQLKLQRLHDAMCRVLCSLNPEVWSGFRPARSLKSVPDIL